MDFSALSADVSPLEVKEFRRQNPQLTSKPSEQAFSIAALVLAGVVVFGTFVGSTFTTGAEQNLIASALVLLALTAIAVATIFFAIFARRSLWARLLRLSRFSQANGLSFTANGAVPAYPGMIFGIGSSRTVPERISQISDPFFDIGNLAYTTGSGRSRTTHHWGYVAVKLDRMLPHMILDAKSNNFFFSNLPNTFSRSQVLSLEGEFDRHFTVYCPQEYEQDALYILTPDLMAGMIDDASNLDVEIIDDWIFFYSNGDRNLSDRGTLSSVFTLIDSVGVKTLRQTERYADDRMSTVIGSDGEGTHPVARMAINQVAFQGRRLRTGIPVAAILITVGVGAWWLVNLVLR